MTKVIIYGCNGKMGQMISSICMEDPEIEEGVFFENVGYAVLEGAGKQSAEKPYLFVAGFSD